jgi:hypothetical protein
MPRLAAVEKLGGEADWAAALGAIRTSAANHSATHPSDCRTLPVKTSLAALTRLHSFRSAGLGVLKHAPQLRRSRPEGAGEGVWA